ncbi:MAG: tryptophan 2,3-dioxygenase, partial [Acidobacteria bacterium]|nr:tryptophan 2,3-dioxygenase [Acidobacteriota bacterium]
ERYLRTDELLALQKTPDEMAHHDELLFQTVHQSSELWLKLSGFEIQTASDLLQRGETAPAIRLLRRAGDAMRLVTEALHHLEAMSPWEYQTIRRVLGHGSGFDSPGFRGLMAIAPPLWDAFRDLLKNSELTVEGLYVRGREFDALYEIAELLVEWDEQVMLWKYHHFKMVQRIIGSHVIGTQGTPVEVLGARLDHPFFPELWAVRDKLTALAQTNSPTTASTRPDVPTTPRSS